ncbi:rod shape-determining protein MreC [Synechococcus sp. CCY 0621]|uniref:rod shape-determining protein MreC n=1 Tax=Synechococcus sp. CCY 0621 TaxID=2815603 RepID=UPI001C2499B9|nr:rod shape-determining protein MreC [Synechococcus sp. CCY 0621]
MPAWRWLRFVQGSSLRRITPWLLVLLALVAVRLSKGALVADTYAFLSRPFWPGTAQAEWLRSARRVEDGARLAQLEQDNQRLRTLLELQKQNPNRVTAPVISRDGSGWWRQLLLGQGALSGIRAGQAVLGPGGLVGLVGSVTPSTASVTLLTDPRSRVGVWVGRTQHHGLLTGIGTGRPLLRFLEKDPQARPGDVVVTSPASTLVPPNLPVGVIQTMDANADPAPEAVVQLIAPVSALDWVQVQVR